MKRHGLVLLRIPKTKSSFFFFKDLIFSFGKVENFFFFKKKPKQRKRFNGVQKWEILGLIKYSSKCAGKKISSLSTNNLISGLYFEKKIEIYYLKKVTWKHMINLL